MYTDSMTTYHDIVDAHSHQPRVIQLFHFDTPCLVRQEQPE